MPRRIPSSDFCYPRPPSAMTKRQAKKAQIPIFLLIILIPFAAAASSNQTKCATKLEALAPCLPLADAPPTGTVPQKCCNAIAAAFNSTGSGDSCICHLLQRPHVLGLLFHCKTTPDLSVECREESVSDDLKEAIREPFKKFEGSCEDTYCCLKQCKKRLPATLYAIYKVINGAHVCSCFET